MDDTPIGLESDLADLTGMALDDLRTADDSPLAHSIRRILAESKEEGTQSVVAGHETHI